MSSFPSTQVPVTLYFSEQLPYKLFQWLENNHTIHLDKLGQPYLDFPGRNDAPQAELDIKFVPEGSMQKAIAYDMGRIEAMQESQATVLFAQQQLATYEAQVLDKIKQIRDSPAPAIPDVTQKKIDSILKGLDVINFQPLLASFGELCATERELLDRCYLGNPTDTIACNDYAVRFQQCVYKDEKQDAQKSSL